jgi:1-deoxy-D-xylulose-5-phosphate synthase
MISGISHIFTLEEGIQSGGFGETLARGLGEFDFPGHVCNIAVSDPMIRAASPDEQIKEAGLDASSVSEKISRVLGRL